MNSLSTYYNVQLKYSGQIISVRMTDEQRNKYEALNVATSTDRADYIAELFPEIPKGFCTALAVNGDWNVGNWFDIAVPLHTLRETTQENVVIRNIYEVSFSGSMLTEFWCSIETVSLDRMVKTLEIPRVICQDIYNFSEGNHDATLTVYIDAETNEHTMRR